MWGAGLFALGGFADCVGLTGALSAAVPRRGERAPVHDRGAVLVHALLTVAAGGEACSDIEHLRAQRELFGGVASDSALCRVITGLGAGGAAALLGAAAQVRPQMWAGRDRGGPLVARVDAAGASPALVGELVERNIGYVISARSSPAVTAAVRSALGEPSLCHDVLDRPKQRRSRAQVADLADLSGRPPRTRLVVRREPRHPGAQRTPNGPTPTGPATTHRPKPAPTTPKKRRAKTIRAIHVNNQG